MKRKDRENIAIWLWHNRRAGAALIDLLLDADQPETEREFLKRLSSRDGCPAEFEAIQAHSPEGAEIRETYRERGITLYTRGEAGYPQQLATCGEHIPVISVAGNTALLSERQAAVVGSREGSPEGIAIAEHIVQALMARGFVITSGGAIGTDAAAHRTAMKALRPTVIVTATDVEHIYPKENADIFEYARRYGAVVSQYPSGTKPQRQLFPGRNTLIAGLCCATIIAYCRENSGALYTARAARKMNRPVLVAATRGFDPLHEGGLTLIKQGVATLLSADRDLEILGGHAQQRCLFDPPPIPPTTAAAEPDNPPASLPDDPLWRRILAVLGTTPLGRDELSRRLDNLPMSILATTLLDMELDGWVSSFQGRYSIAGG